MKSFSVHNLLEPKFAEARIKEISAVFRDYEVSLAIYNKEAGFKDEFYIPEQKEPIYRAPEPELLIPEPIFEKRPLPGIFEEKERRVRGDEARRKREEETYIYNYDTNKFEAFLRGKFISSGTELPKGAKPELKLRGFLRKVFLKIK
jgi:hypothetical protein